MKKILITDDEPGIADVLGKYAALDDYEVFTAANGLEAVKLASEQAFDIIVMDIMMPGLDGITAAKQIRKFSDVPILFLSAKGDESDRITGFENGGDDYVAKPFSNREVMLRINAIVKRREAGSNSGNVPYGTINQNIPELQPPQKEIISFGGLAIDISGREVLLDGKQATLTPKEFDLLLFMARNKGFALSRDQLLQKVWGYDFFGDDRTVDTHIKMLRSHLGKYKRDIVTVRSVGYKFEGGV
ncbi:MAG: response regulator transcription factor [Oscillospiraceae bacterium]|jgi:DNA-binding response OmpR family regulator|nr:response regulator transcription factor [Oscillospiraceae bacterium]